MRAAPSREKLADLNADTIAVRHYKEKYLLTHYRIRVSLFYRSVKVFHVRQFCVRAEPGSPLKLRALQPVRVSLLLPGGTVSWLRMAEKASHAFLPQTELQDAKCSARMILMASVSLGLDDRAAKEGFAGALLPRKILPQY